MKHNRKVPLSRGILLNFSDRSMKLSLYTAATWWPISLTLSRVFLNARYKFQMKNACEIFLEAKQRKI